MYRPFKYACAAAPGILLFATPVLADNTEQCLQRYYMHAYAQALPFCTRSATTGSSQSQYVLGLMYSNGLGLKQNKPEAMKWLRAAAEQAHAAAHYKLEQLENEVDSSDDALKRFMAQHRAGASARAPRQNQAPSSHQPAADDNTLFQRYLSAAQQGDAEARFMLGLFYLEGRGVEQSTNMAASQFKLAATQGQARAQFVLGLMYYHGRGDIMKNEKMAKHWLTKAAMQGLADAQYSLGLLYARDEPHMADAIRWWRKAAAQQHAKAQHNLAISYLTGQGVQANRNTAMQWFIQEARQGDPQAQFDLGRLYSEGKWFEQNGRDAANWFFRAGAAWVNMHQTDKARRSAEKIRQLVKQQHLTVPNLFLADVLSLQIEEAGLQ